MENLLCIGIKRTPHEWIRSFISNRCQFVSVTLIFGNTNTQMSSANVNIDIGISQGSMLRPILFTLYINEMDKNFLENMFITICADDTSIMLYNNYSEDLI